MFPFEVIFLLLFASGFFLLPWTYYRYRTELSRWDGLVMSVALSLPTALASVTVVFLVFLVLDQLFSGVPFQFAGLISLFLPWLGIIWFPLSAKMKKKNV